MLGPVVVLNTILYCREWDATVRFYRETLRLPVLFSTEWFVEFDVNGASRLSIADERRASVKSCGGNGITLALQVADVEAAWKRAQEKGLEPTAIKGHAWNARTFFLFDPEGHRIEVWQRVPPCAQGDVPEIHRGGVENENDPCEGCGAE